MTVPNEFEKTVVSGVTKAPIETAAEAHPAIEAYSTTNIAAVTAINTTNGNGVLGKGTAGDGVHGESSGGNFSGVAGIHSAGGKGVYGSSSGNAGFFDGNVQVNGKLTVTGDIFLPGADCAEQFDSVGGQMIEPGTLVVIDENGALAESQKPYDRKVAGVVAGAGTYRPGIVLDKQPDEQPTDAHRVVISLMGKAYCKVDAAYGEIEIGDLLTSSPSAGYAMKASDREKAFGTIVGKALRPLASGKGIIPILIALQ
jgi:hypothetical protein